MGSTGILSEVNGNVDYRFDRFTVNEKNRLLYRDNEEISLTPRVFDVLLVFLANPGRILEKDELIAKVWDAKFVEEGNLARNVSTLRKALGGNARDHRFIVTVPGRGYRFVADVQKGAVEEPGPARSIAPNGRAVESVEVESIENGEGVISNADPILPPTAQSRRKFLARVVFTVTAAAFLIAAATIAFRYRASSAESVSDASSIRSIAVIRLKNLSGNDADEYFSDGITESLVNALSKIDGLKIVSPGSSERFRTEEPDPIALGKQFAVDAILEGSVRKDNDSVRLDVRLLSVKDGQVLWTGDSSEHIVKDIFSLQDEIALGIADKVKISLTVPIDKAVSRRYTESPEAYQLYLKGRYYWNKRTAEGLKKGIEYFRQAIAVDPNYALAYAGIADCYAMLFSYDVLPPSESVPAAKNAALEAIKLDPTLAEPHCSLAYVETEYDWDWQSAENQYREGISLDPNYATCHHWYALHLAYRSRFDESLQQIKLAQELEPLSLVINSNYGRILFFARQYDLSGEQLRSTIDLDPNFWGSHYKLAEVLETVDRKQEAIEEYARAYELQGDDELAGRLRNAFAVSGYKGSVQNWLGLSLQRAAKTHVSPFNFAEIYADLGQTDSALDWLQKSADEHSPWIILINSDPRFDKLRDNERFKALVNKIGF